MATHDMSHSMASTGGFAESHFASAMATARPAMVPGFGGFGLVVSVFHLYGSALGTSPERPHPAMA